MTLCRGPQSVQVMNGYRYRRLPVPELALAGIATPTSGETGWRPAAVAACEDREVSARGCLNGSILTASIRASGGASAPSSGAKRSEVLGVPSTSISTVPARVAHPARQRVPRREPVHERTEPTPWTTPVTVVQAHARPGGAPRSAWTGAA